MSDQLDHIVEPLEQELQKLHDQEELAREELDGIVETRRRVEKTLNYLKTGSANPPTKAKPSKAKPRSVPKQEVLDQVHDAVPPQGDATVPELAKGLDLHSTTVRDALEVLRERELVRKAGERRSAHDEREHGSKATAWARL